METNKYLILFAIIITTTLYYIFGKDRYTDHTGHGEAIINKTKFITEVLFLNVLVIVCIITFYHFYKKDAYANTKPYESSIDLPIEKENYLLDL